MRKKSVNNGTLPEDTCPDEVPFGDLPDSSQIEIILAHKLGGSRSGSVTALAEKFGCSRGLIYRRINSIEYKAAMQNACTAFVKEIICKCYADIHDRIFHEYPDTDQGRKEHFGEVMRFVESHRDVKLIALGMNGDNPEYQNLLREFLGQDTK
jgi:hypothetical protein